MNLPSRLVKALLVSVFAFSTCASAGIIMPNGKAYVGPFPTVKGKCTKLIIDGKDLTGDCRDFFQMIDYENVVSSLDIAAHRYLAIQILLNGARTKKIKGGLFEQSVPEIAILPYREGGKLKVGDFSHVFKATGSCQFGNFFVPKPTQIACAGHTKNGNFAFEFTTDGSLPTAITSCPPTSGSKQPVANAPPQFCIITYGQ